MLQNDGVKMTVYMNPHLIQGSNMFNEAEEKGFLMIDSKGDSYLEDFGGFLGGTVDLFNEFGRDWYKSKQLNSTKSRLSLLLDQIV